MIAAAVYFSRNGGTAQAKTLTLIRFGTLPSQAAYAVERLGAELKTKGWTLQELPSSVEPSSEVILYCGIATEPAIRKRVLQTGAALPDQAEGYTLVRAADGSRRRLIVCGKDGPGLMYGLLDVAAAVRTSSHLQAAADAVQTGSFAPFLTDRAVSTYTMQRRLFEQRLHDPAYWETLFDMLAESRINSYVIIFGYENGGFMAPPYPFFFDVEGFPEVKLNDISPRQQQANTEALRRLIRQAHRRGIRVTLGIWDHIYRGGVQSGGIDDDSARPGAAAGHLVTGVTKENLAAYTKAALTKLLVEFPEIDGIQFRMHWESGLTREETPGFWRDVFAKLHEIGPKIRFDLRAKGLPDEVIDEAVRQNLPFRIATKYWMEQMGLPFHPTHVNPQNQRDRRHGYADLLRYPRRYEMHWRLWNGGTTRMLLWGDPDYVRRFAESCRLYDGRSFEVNEMLATKMLGEPHDAEPFSLLQPEYRFYRYECERYWYFYRVWGRLTYDPTLADDFASDEFVSRFGESVGPHVMVGLHHASRVLPRIVAAAYNYRFFPTTRGWAEMMRFGDLATYAAGTGTDIEQFESYHDAAKRLLAGESTTLRSPLQTARWFETTAETIENEIAAIEADQTTVPERSRQELETTLCDLRALAGLARYHAARMRAAVWYHIAQETQAAQAKSECINAAENACRAWRSIAEAAEGIYSDDVAFGVHRVGFPRNWREELTALEAELPVLQEMQANEVMPDEAFARLKESIARDATRPDFRVSCAGSTAAAPGKDYVVAVQVTGDVFPAVVRLHYRHVTQFEDYEVVTMAAESAHGKYRAAIPGEFIVPEWDTMYFVEVAAEDGSGGRYPDLDAEMPYIIVPTVR
ncbi:hypothetical protein JCM19992_19480 [Thermostilla marina]